MAIIKYRAYKILLCMLSAAFTAYAQPTESSLLWKISGNNLVGESYLFGSMHMICAEDFVLKEKVLDAVEKSKKMCFELDLSNPSELMMMEKMMYSDKPITADLDETAVRKLDQILRDEYQTDLKTVEHWPKTNIISLMLTKAASCSQIQHYDLVLMEMGLRQQKKMVGLESISEQFELVESLYSAQDVLNQLTSLEASTWEFKELVRLYLAEDINGLLDSASTQEFGDPILMKKLLTDRNYQWSQKIPAIIAAESTLIVVGAAHLAGSEGVIQLLRNQGYSVQPVF